MGRLAFPPRTWRCALCRLRHQELLDAAHITPDSEAEGEPLVSRVAGLAWNLDAATALRRVEEVKAWA